MIALTLGALIAVVLILALCSGILHAVRIAADRVEDQRTDELVEFFRSLAETP